MTNIQIGNARSGLVRRGPWLAGAGAVFVTLIMALSQGAGAASPRLVTYHAPYSGTVSSSYVSGSLGGCLSAISKSVKPHWTQATGLIAMGVAVKASSCGGTNSGSSAYSDYQITIAVPFSVAANGTHNVSVKWNYSALITKAIHTAGTCPPPVITNGYGYSYCNAYATASIGANVHVEDLTNHTWWYPSNYWGGATNGTSISSNENCYGGVCNFGNSSSNSYGGLGVRAFTWWINATLSKGDKVIVVFSVYGYANANAYGYAKASASASFDMASAGHLGDLARITVT